MTRRRELARPSRMKLLVRRNRRNLRLGVWAISGFAVVLVGVSVAHSAQNGGAIAALQQRFGRAIDLRVKDIRIDGLSNTPESALRQALGVNKGDPILGFSVGDARQRIEALSWVQHVAVERRLPATIYVDLTERRPFAIWQNQGKFQLVDRAGAVVTNEDVAAFTDKVPLVVGEGAPAHALDMVSALAAVPDIRARVDAIVRVGDRRWNLLLKNKVTVMLPEGHETAALTRLAELQQQQQILDRPLQSVDMRLGDRLVLHARAADALVPAGGDTRPAEAKPAEAPHDPTGRRAT